MAEPSFIDQSKLRFREGEIIFRKGEMAQQMYIILAGKVRLYVSEEPKGDWAEELAKGDFFGEGSLLEALPRLHTAMALEDSDLIAINRGTFLRMIRQNPEVSVKMMQRLAQRHRELGQRLEALDAHRAAKAPSGPVANLVSVLGGRPHPILAHGSLIGRFDPTTGVHPDIDLTEEDHNLSVSRRHARILCEHGRYFLLEEPGVANGTFVRGERIQPGEPRELKPGDRVGFGMVVMFFEKA
ncbi:cyclic nucleotide-binding domain-containing protein [Geothrix sp. 21YS21S-4]|uniref:cyclic nucleotide-binding domain-containing protein n=1 Tax=Geothrix sp. 21YS21S-4 TaxID=3068889 RepID=UPI0027BB07FF|nr:cyclic nucleotide-binding domain-containing protein [Geothrix sp. 21YS21S-4]